MNLKRYLDRIGYRGSTRPTLEVLRDIHRAHACGITYENLDVVLQTPVDQDIGRIFNKIVDQGRGGWCYEMNGLLGWALTEIGFDVTRVCGGVMRTERGDDSFGNHLMLRVRLDEQDWIADVGLGDGIIEPILLTAGTHSHYGRSFRLERLAAQEWRFHNRSGGLPLSYDFVEGTDTERRLAHTCASLQNDPESMFRQNVICQRMSEVGGVMLLGRVLRDFDPKKPRLLLDSETELKTTLSEVFKLKVPPLANLWSQVEERHQLLFGDTPVEDIHFGPPSSAAEEN